MRPSERGTPGGGVRVGTRSGSGALRCLQARSGAAGAATRRQRPYTGTTMEKGASDSLHQVEIAFLQASPDQRARASGAAGRVRARTAAVDGQPAGTRGVDERTVARHLAGAELWARVDADVAPNSAGAALATADLEAGSPAAGRTGSPWHSSRAGRTASRSAPRSARRTSAFSSAAAAPRKWPLACLPPAVPARGRCRAGGALLGFPAPRGSRTTAAVLRVGPPGHAGRRPSRIGPGSRRAHSGGPPDRRRRQIPGRRSPRPAILRNPARLFEWQVQQRARGSDRRRTATAALAQMVATSEEFYELYRDSQRQRRELERNQRRLDRLAQQTLQASDMERTRIAHQIHDTAAQSMVSAFRFLDAARAYAAGAPRPVRWTRSWRTPRSAWSLAIKEVRAVLDDLLPPGLEELGLCLRRFGAASGRWLPRPAWR